MNKCTSVVFLSPTDHVVSLFAPVHRLEARHVLCELGEDHGDDHADMVWDEGGRPGSAVWARWNGRDVKLASLPWCPALTAEEDACGLFADHPSAHTWDVTDPTLEALRQELAKERPHRSPEFTEEGGE
ncbi:hypothetical protein RM717_01265 [Streptomyces griseus]|uniref:Uncharacterized protein n=1 Tax=Streptomyces stephensoniae TaxID=3375367 RepID=A0ABU2VV04_9ACTN|nr:hypothetical protein [Streptomyces griseus]MDT0489133.1 hypothetical protein [Streptomyces griseus]